MNEPQKDTQRTVAAAKEIIVGRGPMVDRGAVMVTLEETVAAVLLMVMGGDQKKAAAMLNEELVEGVEGRLALHASRQTG